MSSKKKLIVSMLVVSFVLLSIIATVAIAFALTQQTIKTTLNIGYTVEDIDGTASASFTIGGVTESLVAMKGTNVIGDKLVFKAGDTENAGNLMFPEDALALSAQNDNVVIQYTYSNTGAKHYIASMDFGGVIDADNMKVEYSIDGTTYSEDRYAVVVPANTSNRSYWIKISIADKAKSASFTGDFNWLLNGCDEQAEDYLTIASTEFQATGTAGAYSVKLNGEGYLPGGEVVFPSEVNGDPVTTISESTLSDEQKAAVTSVYIPDSVETIGANAFDGYSNLETVTFEQNKTNVASVQSETGLKTIGSSAFRSCLRLSQFIIPDTVTSLESTAFQYSGLTSIIIPDTVTSLPGGVFANCVKLETVTLCGNTTNSAAFANCTNIKNLIIKSTSEDFAVFIYMIANESGNLNLTIEDISGNGTIAYGLSRALGLTNVTLKGIATLGANVFTNCKDLKKVVFSSDLKTIQANCFKGCNKLESVEFDKTTGWVVNGNAISSTDLENSSTAAAFLSSTYCEVEWNCN